MKNLITSMNRSPLRCGFFTVAIALCWFALSPSLKAQCPTACSAGNTSLGLGALDSVTSAINNTAVGSNALRDDSSGSYNVAVGGLALANNTSGQQNMAIGAEALLNSNGNFNLAIGFRVGFQNTTGSRLTGIGAAALRNNTTASDNTAIGSNALRENTITDFNVAVGDMALAAFNGTTGNDGANTALGSISLSALTSGEENVAVGRRSLEFLTGGSNNTAVGWRAGDNYNGSENGNIVIGSAVAGTSGENNTIRIGTNLPSGGLSVSNSGGVEGFTLGDGFSGGGIQYLQTVLGETVSIAANFSTVLGASHCFVGGIFNQTPTAGSHLVYVGPDNKLADATLSSRRFKKDIAPMDKISEGILALKPVTFHWKSDKTNEPEFGLIAEEVAKVNPDWITRDSQGEVIGVRYETIPVLLLNEFLKEHKKVEEQQASIADLKSTVALQQKEMQVLTAQLKEQADQIQKVSAQLEASKPAPKVVANK